MPGPVVVDASMASLPSSSSSHADSINTSAISIDRLEQHQRAFDHLIELIPAKFYLPTKDDEEMNTKFMHNKKKRAAEGKEFVKKAKKAKLDPDNYKTAIDIQSEQLDQSTSTSTSTTTTTTNAPETTTDSTEMKPMESRSIGDLRSRLHDRIQKLRQRRGASPLPSPSTTATTSTSTASSSTSNLNADGNPDNAGPKSRQDLLQRRAEKRKEKQEKKARMKKNKESRGHGVKDTFGMGLDKDGDDNNNSNKNNGKSGGKIVEDVSFGNIQFSSTPGIEDMVDPSDVKKKKKGASDAKTQLKKLETQKEKLEALKQSNPEKAKDIEEKETWKKAMKLAAGEKVKDDISLLKRTIKKQDQQKKKSGKEWTDRIKSQTYQKSERQKKRQENIQKRKEDKKGSGKGKGKGKARAGFEGKRGKK